MGWHFRASEIPASVSVPRRRDVRAGNSQVLERIGIYHMRKLARDGMATLVLKKDGNDPILEKIDINQHWHGPHNNKTITINSIIYTSYNIKI